jgi:hypothetical protein
MQSNAKKSHQNLCGIPRHLVYQHMRQSTAVDVLEKAAYTRRVKEG